MADQKFTVNSGFYDAVNEDRLYTADDMNKPYKRVVADGVFATPAGEASTDLQVRSAGSGMGIIVAPGEGLCGAKWFNNPADLAITVPNNTALNSRIDSVIMQVDKSLAVRAGSIVYRTGYPAASPNPPSLVNNDDVSEYRLANVTVAPATTSIPDSVITDTRGSADCPWVTSLIQQVDTSALWAQYQAAYAEQFEKFKEDYDAYTAAQRESWAEFLQTLTDDLSVTMDLVELESKYTATGAVTEVPINISGYNSATDILEVFINGLYAKEGDKYTISSDGTQIVLTNSIAAGNSVYFHVLKSVIGADSESAVTMMQRLEKKVDDFIGMNSQTVSNTVKDWLDENVTPVGSAVVVDSSLTIEGAAADAKVTGDRLNDLKSGLNLVSNEVIRKTVLLDNYVKTGNGGVACNFTSGKNYTVSIKTSGAGTTQFQTVNGSTPIDVLTPVQSGDIDTTVEFTATGNASALYCYVGSSTATATVTVVEVESLNLDERISENKTSIDTIYSDSVIYSHKGTQNGQAGAACYKVASTVNRAIITKVEYKGSNGSIPKIYLVKNGLLTGIIPLSANDGTNYISYSKPIYVDSETDIFIGGASGGVYYGMGGTDDIVEFDPTGKAVGDSVTYTTTTTAHFIWNCELLAGTSSDSAAITINNTIKPCYPKTVVAIIDDDTNYLAPTIWGAILQNNADVKIGFACLTGYMNGTYTHDAEYKQMTLAELQAFYNAGHEVYSHGWAGYSVSSLTDDSLADECYKSKDWLLQNGFNRGVNTLVYSGGETYNVNHFDVVRGFYKFGVNAWGGGINQDILTGNPLYLNRVIGDTKTLSELTGLVDNVDATGGILVLGFHSYELNKSQAANIQKIIDLISYIKNKGIAIIPLERAIKQIYGMNV